jgi:beta-lactamase regulating signal transducer with metallopeptidase domain
MILYSLRHRPLALSVVVVLIGLRIAWRPGAGGSMTMTGCFAIAGILVLLASVLSVGARAAWLAVYSSRALAALPRAPVSVELAAAARRAGVHRLICLTGDGAMAFCAGLFRPCVYVTSGGVKALGGEELTAVLVHEREHARRRDPLRRLVARAAADVLVYLPLCGWWRQRQLERAELRADRAAIERVSVRAVARALVVLDGSRQEIPAAAAFDGTTQARIGQLLGEGVPRRRVPVGLAVRSTVGVVLALGLFMCLGQELWIRMI